MLLQGEPSGVMLWYAVVAVVLLVGSCPTGAEAAGMEDTVKDLYDAPPERQARFFLNYDKAAAFNTSVAFTIPLFSFTLPGASDTSAAGMDLQAFGALAFVALFLLGGLGVAIYTTTQAGSFGSGRDFVSSREETSQQESILTTLVTESLAGLPNVVDTESCAQLAVCGAHADPSKYGLLAWPVRFLVPSAPEVPEEELTLYQRAARFGEEREDAEVECQFEYPCLVQPLDLLLYIYDYWYGEE
ncbi:uncharacterized protein [Macrobrachium rosenbergii]|uniref:uncharacterized protein isoform X2 n=1 Tax=Macrobrachium rosenbergii TaxID=79674 RepID=UPI0034D52589